LHNENPESTKLTDFVTPNSHLTSGKVKYVDVLKQFLSSELKLELHPDKVIFRKLEWGIDFLGYLRHANSFKIIQQLKNQVWLWKSSGENNK